MNYLFKKKPSLKIRLYITVTLSVILLLMEHVHVRANKFRSSVDNLIGVLYYVVNAPNDMLDFVTNRIITKESLLLENETLKKQLLAQQASLLVFDALKMENDRLRLLLNSPLRTDEHKKIAEVLSISIDNTQQQVLINKGSKDGVFVGQSAITDSGVVGQVILVSNNQSRILLLSDSTSAIPVEVLRSDVRTIATGTGQSDELSVDFIPKNADIKIGDTLVTSGLDGKYTEGYPVAKIVDITANKNDHFLSIKAEPLARLDKLRYILLLWTEGAFNKKSTEDK